MTGSAQKCPNRVERDQRGQNGTESIFHELLVAESWNTLHFNQKYHVSMTVSYLFHTSQMTESAQKCPNREKRDQKGKKGSKEVKSAKMGPMEPKSISNEPVVLGTWYTPHFNQQYHVSMTVSYLFHTSQMTASAQKCPNRVKRDQKRAKMGQNLYLNNLWL